MSRSILILKRDLSLLGGAEKYTRKIASALHEKGAKVTLLTTGPTPDPLPYEVVTMGTLKGSSFHKIAAFDKFCNTYRKSHSFDKVFSFDRNSFQTHLRTSSGTHRAYLSHRKEKEPFWKGIRHQINPLHRLILHVEKKGFENPALETLFTNSHLVKREVLAHYAVPEEKIAVVHNGVEWEKWQRDFDLWESHYLGERHQFLFVGNNFERKGLSLLLKGLSLLKEGDFHLSVVGSDKNLAEYKNLAERLNLGAQVTFHGPQKEICPFYQKADTLVIPSLYDPFANVTIEALAMGLYVVSSKTNGGGEILTLQNGTLIEDLSSPEAMVSALSSALKHPKTPKSAQEIRHGVKSMDFSLQLEGYLNKLL